MYQYHFSVDPLDKVLYKFTYIILILMIFCTTLKITEIIKRKRVVMLR